MLSLTSQLIAGINGDVQLSGDKSLSHRAIILASIAAGQSKIYNLLESDDILSTIQTMQQLGATIVKKSDHWSVTGVGNGCLLQSQAPLYFGNSGTGARLIMGLVSSYDMVTEFTGDSSLSKRPMLRILEPLKLMGTQILSSSNDFTLPITIKGSYRNAPISYILPVASAQVKSAILLAALNTTGTTEVIETSKSRDHTEIMLKEFGANITIEDSDKQSTVIRIQGGSQLKPCELNLASDPSSAAFLIIAATIVPNSSLTLRNILINPTRIGFIQILKQMGAKIAFKNPRIANGEKIADIYVESARLKAVTIDEYWVPSTIDEYPILAIAAAVAEGTSSFLGIGELRFKESDRIKSIVEALQICKIECSADDNSLTIEGIAGPLRKDETKSEYVINSYGDHRIAMSLLVLGLASDTPIKVNQVEMIKTSFPEFTEIMNQIGANIHERT